MDVILYNTEDGKVQLDVQLNRETVWLNQRQMAELFDKDTDTITLHILISTLIESKGDR